jgi:hypothetical protein
MSDKIIPEAVLKRAPHKEFFVGRMEFSAVMSVYHPDDGQL